MSSPPEVLMFGGPTLFRARSMRPDLDLGDLIVLPPIRRGDLTRIVTSRTTPGILIIADGLFHLENLSVGHLEIRLAMRKAWTVWGLSSMGAIRAAEMHHMGMRGWGQVFERYRDDPDFRDDEVALLHEPTPPYREGSEPLVHIRFALADLVARRVIAESDMSELIDHLMSQWFGVRSLPLVRDLVLARYPEKEAEIASWIKGFDRYRVKALDLIDFLEKRPFRTMAGEIHTP